MKNLDLLARLEGSGDRLRQRYVQARGAYPTPEHIGRVVARRMLADLGRNPGTMRIIEPFGGDGRLIELFIDEAKRAGLRTRWDVTLWEIDPETAKDAAERIGRLADELNLRIDVRVEVRDSFELQHDALGSFDVVITNPPWETVKPDRRMLADLAPEARTDYVQRLRALDQSLTRDFPEAQPSRKFAGWGTNLSRPGLSLSVRLLRPGGALGIVLPSSTFADTLHGRLRRWLLTQLDIKQIDSYSAEARHFSGMDVPFVTVVGVRAEDGHAHDSFELVLHEAAGTRSVTHVDLREEAYQRGEWCLPLTPAAMPLDVLARLRHLPTLGELLESGRYWAGRELDETGIRDQLSPAGDTAFLKGRNITRLSLATTVSGYLGGPLAYGVRTRTRPRLVWRDVTRPSQTRRVQATLIGRGPVTGNSLGVVVSKDDSLRDLYWLLGIMSSCTFEAQLRTVLSTGHVTLASLKQVHVPPRKDWSVIPDLTRRILDSPSPNQAADHEGLVAQEYGLTMEDLERLLRSHDWIEGKWRNQVLNHLRE